MAALVIKDPILFWTAAAAIGQIAGAIATFLAVLVSLWIVTSERRAHIKVAAGLRMVVAGDGSPFRDVISIRITNHGLRPVRVSNISWRTGWLRWAPKQFLFQNAVQLFNHPVSVEMSSDRPPFDLAPGQEAHLALSPETYRERTEMRDTFFNRPTIFRKGIKPTKVCIGIHLIAAKQIYTRVEPGLEKFLATGVIDNGAEKANKAADEQVAYESQS